MINWGVTKRRSMLIVDFQSKKEVLIGVHPHNRLRYDSCNMMNCMPLYILHNSTLNIW